MKQLLLSFSTVIFAVLCAVTLRGFIYGDQHGDPEYHILLFSMLLGGVICTKPVATYQTNLN